MFSFSAIGEANRLRFCFVVRFLLRVDSDLRKEGQLWARLSKSGRITGPNSQACGLHKVQLAHALGSQSGVWRGRRQSPFVSENHRTSGLFLDGPALPRHTDTSSCQTASYCCNCQKQATGDSEAIHPTKGLTVIAKSRRTDSAPYLSLHILYHHMGFLLFHHHVSPHTVET